MVYVKLLEDVAEGGRSLKAALAAAEAIGMSPKDRHYPRLKITGRKRQEYVKGAVVTMHEASAAKWVKRGIAEVVKAPKGA